MLFHFTHIHSGSGLPSDYTQHTIDTIVAMGIKIEFFVLELSRAYISNSNGALNALGLLSRPAGSHALKMNAHGPVSRTVHPAMQFATLLYSFFATQLATIQSCLIYESLT